MSLIDFYCSGPSAEGLRDWDHARAHRSQVSIHKGILSEYDVQETNPLVHKRERIEAVSKKEDNKTWIVDKAVKVIASHTDIQRAGIVDYWNTHYATTLTSCIVSSVLAVGSAITSFFVATTWLKVTCIVAAIALVLFAILSYYRSTEASEQAELWMVHPTTIVAQNRTRAFNESHRYSEVALNDEYRPLVTQKEVTFFHTEDFEKYLKLLQEAEAGDNAKKATFTQEFFASHLLMIKQTAFALGEGPHRLTPYCERYEALRDSYGYADYVPSQQRLLENAKNALLDAYEALYLKDKARVSQEYNASCAAANKKCSEQLDKEQAQDKRAKITAACAQQIEKAAQIFKTRNGILEESRNTYKEQVQRAFQLTSQEITQNKDDRHLYAYPQARDIFLGAYAALHKNKIPAPTYFDPATLLGQKLLAIQKG